MNIKTIVKVMNFHALLRVDRSRKEADQYAMLEREVTHMIEIIQHNRNFILDNWILVPKENMPRMRIYIGSDLGFCGTVNATVNHMLADEDEKNTVITIGRKVYNMPCVNFQMTRDEFYTRYEDIEAILEEGIHARRFSGVDICYNHYHNMTNIEPIVKTIFPIEIERDELETYSEDFTVEGADINTLMEGLVVTYLNYEIKSAVVNAFASENILRQNATNESLKKIDEMEIENRWMQRKIDNQKSVNKVIDSYVKSQRNKKH